ncbi:MAG: right-handed parallel beta-helix repeat-containing protein [Verrucomicrobiales bacterium]
MGICFTLLAAIAPLLALEPVTLPLGGNFQEIIDVHPPGTRYVVAAGVHRGATLVPKDGDVINGEPGAVLNGSLALENWTFDGQWWVHDAPVVTPLSLPGGVECAEPLCIQPQDFYLDGVRLRPVESLQRLLGDRDWFLDRENAKVYLRADPTGLLAELGGPSHTAIDCAPLGRPMPLGVVIEDLTIEKYPCPPQIGAVRLGEGGVIRRCTITRSHSYGVQLMNAACLVQDCFIADNGMCGIGGTGIGAVIEGCEIANNVWSLFAGLPWDNGGVKIAGSRDTVFRRNYIHHNKGPGLWWDIKTTLLTVEANIIEFNDWEGILMEISDQAVIRRNICRWNGVLHRRALWGAQICVQNGAGAEIYENYIETGPDFRSAFGSRQGVIVINQVDRVWDEVYYQGNFSARKITVHDNTFVMPSGGHNGVDYGTLGWPTYQDFLAAGLEWRDNHYLIGRPLSQLWSWRREPNWAATVGKWLAWEDWLTEQDEGSTLEVIGLYDYPPTGTNQLALIEETTGHDYNLLKAELTRRAAPSAADEDGDDLPDAWERRYFPTLDDTDGTADSDGDGLLDADEFEAGTHPMRADTDDDHLPDAWELARGLNPLVFDSHLDPDNDGRPHYEEYEDGTDLAVAEPANLPAPESAVSFWFSPSARLITDPDGLLTRWSAINPPELTAGWFGSPHIAGTTPTSLPLIDPGDMVLVGGAEDRWGTLNSGFTFSFVYQPTEIDLMREWRALLTNEVYRKEGFRLRLESGILVLSSGQSGGTLALHGHTRLKAGTPHLITIAVGPAGSGGSVYLDGHLEATSPTGLVVPSQAALMLGNTNGVARQRGAFGEVIVFRRLLTHRERRSIEGFLQKKFLTGLADALDRDQDGLPDAWELTANLDPLTPNALADDDQDGVSNIQEFQRGLDPQRADTDEDGLPDGWELQWGIDPLKPDASEDLDGDGLNNLEEYQNGSDPHTPDVDPPFMSFSRIRLWWRADYGLGAVEEPGIGRWRDSGPRASDGSPQNPEPAPVLGSQPWNGRPVLRLPENPLVSIIPVDPATLLHPQGVTLTLALRPVSDPPPSGRQPIFSYGDLAVAVENGFLVLQNQNGSLPATSTTPLPNAPFIVTMVAGPTTESAQLFVNGKAVVQLTGLAMPTSAPFQLGGTNPWPCDVAEVILHAGTLSPLDRRFADLLLEANWLGTGRLTADTDGDLLPDWWEHQACSNPKLADAEQDSDWNGESNLDAFQAGRPGFVWRDADADGMHDDWEVVHNLDPQLNDAELDPDHDGLSNDLEFALLTLPETFDGSGSWGIDVSQSEPASYITLHLRTNQRSWAQRARWQANPGLDAGAWFWLPPGTVVKSLPGAVSLEDLILTPDLADGDSRALLRLRLLSE